MSIVLLIALGLIGLFLSVVGLGSLFSYIKDNGENIVSSIVFIALVVFSILSAAALIAGFVRLVMWFARL